MCVSPAVRACPPSGVVGFVYDFVNPSQKPANTCVHPREGRVTTAMTPGDNSCENPVAPLPLANQRTPTVTLATVHPVALRQAPCTQHAVGEAFPVGLLAPPGRQQGDPGLQQGAGVLRVCEAPAGDHAGGRPLLPPAAHLRQTHGCSVRVERHTAALCAFEPQQGNVVLPALTVVLPVDNDAFR